MKKITKTKNKNTLDEINFRLQFKEVYGIDYNEALDVVRKRKQDSENKWSQVLTNNGLR